MTLAPDFIRAYGVRRWVEGGRTHGSCAVRPDLFVPGTDRVRVGHLASLADIIGGMPPSGPVLPTLDLRVRLVSRPPAAGEIRLVNEPLKDGARFFVAEVPMFGDGAARPFAHSTVTFLNQRVPDASLGGGEDSLPVEPTLFSDLLAVRHPDAQTAEIDWEPRIGNGPHGTILGAVQAVLAELAAEHALAKHGRYLVNDLDVRFLNRVKVGPLAARAGVLARDPAGASVKVVLTDRGSEGRLVAVASALCEALGPGSSERACV